MLSRPAFLVIVESGCKESSGTELARALIVDKNDGLFQDLVLSELVRTHPELLVR